MTMMRIKWVTPNFWWRPIPITFTTYIFENKKLRHKWIIEKGIDGMAENMYFIPFPFLVKRFIPSPEVTDPLENI